MSKIPCMRPALRTALAFVVPALAAVACAAPLSPSSADAERDKTDPPSAVILPDTGAHGETQAPVSNEAGTAANADVAADGPVDFGVDEGDTFCEAAAKYNDVVIELFTNPPPDPDGLRNAITGSIIGLGKLEPLAPNDLKGDIRTIKETMEAIDRLLTKYGYDGSNPEVAAAMSADNPEFDAAVTRYIQASRDRCEN